MLVALREMLVSDVDAVSTIEDTIAVDPWSRELFRGEFDLSAAQRCWLVAHVDSDIIGFIGVMYAADESHILNVGVVSQFRRSGVGYQLLEAVVGRSLALHHRCIHLEVRAGNLPALSLYQKAGFAVVGKRDRYYSNGDSALLLTKLL